MLAGSLQQWARRYLTITQPARCSPHKRARARAFFASGVEKFHVPWAIDALPAMVHLSLFIFFAGLLVYLFIINHTVFKVVTCWVALLTTVGIRIGHVYANCLARQSLLFAAFLNNLVPSRRHSACCPESSPSHSTTFLLSNFLFHRFLEAPLPQLGLCVTAKTFHKT